MSKQKAKWEAEVLKAKEGVDTGLPPLQWGACSCKENELLLRFLMCDHTFLGLIHTCRLVPPVPLCVGAAVSDLDSCVIEHASPCTNLNTLHNCTNTI
jgi:hypothetical protein